MTATAICIYRVKAGSEGAFTALLQKHWPTLHKAGLAADEPSVIYAGEEKGGGPIFVEILQWKRADSSERAHELPAVMSVWEPMGALCESRDGKPAMEFPHCRKLELDFAAS